MVQPVMTFHRSILLELWGLELEVVQDFSRKVAFLEKNDPLRRNFQNFVPKGFTVSRIHVLCANFVKFGRPEVGEMARCLPDEKKQTFGSLSCFCADRVQYLPAPAATMYSEFPKFHPNRLTSSAVIAERVNAVQTHHKMFSILGEVTAFTPSNYTTDRICDLMQMLTSYTLQQHLSRLTRDFGKHII